MVQGLCDFISFEEWFIKKLIKEKKRRITLIKSLWNTLTVNERKDLFLYINDGFLLQYSSAIVINSYELLYKIVKEHIENSFEKIEEWKRYNRFII